MRHVSLVCSLLMAFSASLFGLGCGAAKPDDAAKAQHRALSLGWMPVETEVLIHVKVAELWKAPLLQGLVHSTQAARIVEDLRKNTGLTPADIENATIGAADLAGIQSAVMGQFAGMSASSFSGNGIIVIRTRKPVSLDEILKASDEIKGATYKSKKYFETVSGDQFGGWIADSTTVVLAPVADLKAAMDRGETVTPRKELTFMDATSHVVMIVAPKDPKFLSKGMGTPAQGSPPEMVAMQKVLAESLPAYGIGINIRGGIDLRSSLMLGNSAGADTVKAGFESAIADGRKQFAAVKGFVAPDLAELGEMLLSNAKVETQNQVVTFSTNVPDSAQQKLEEVPPMLLGMFGLGGGPGPFGTGRGAEMTPASKTTASPKKSTGRKVTGRKPKSSGAGSTTGGGVEVPAEPAGGTTEKPDKTSDEK